MAVIGQVALLCQSCQALKFLLGEGSDEVKTKLLSDIVERLGRQNLDEECQLVLVNELVVMVESAQIVHKPFLAWLHQYISERYLDMYLGDDEIIDDKVSCFSETDGSGELHKKTLPMSIRCRSLHGLGKRDFAVQIFSRTTLVSTRNPISVLPSSLHLSAVLLSNYIHCKDDGFLDFLCLLGAPLEMPTPYALENADEYTPRARAAFWRALKHAIDWTREVLSCNCDMYFLQHSHRAKSPSPHTSDNSWSESTTRSLQVQNILEKLRLRDLSSRAAEVHMNNIVACLLVDRFNQLVSLEKELLRLTMAYPDCVDPALVRDHEQLIPTSSSSSTSSNSAPKVCTQAISGTQVGSVVEPDSAETKPKKGRGKSVSKSKDRLTEEEVKDILAASFRRLRPSVSILVGYGVCDLAFNVQDTVMMLRTAGLKSTEGSQCTDMTTVNLIQTPEALPVTFTSSAALQLIKNAADSMDKIVKPSDDPLGAHCEFNSTYEGDEIDSLRPYLEVFYKNRGFIALSRVLDNIVNALQERPPKQSNDCFYVGDGDDPVEAKPMLCASMAIILKLVSSQELRDEVLDQYRRRGGETAPLLLRALYHMVVGETDNSEGHLIAHRQPVKCNDLLIPNSVDGEALPAFDVLLEEGLRGMFLTLNSIASKIKEPSMLESVVEVVVGMTKIAELLKELREIDDPTSANSPEDQVSHLLTETCDALLRRKWEDLLSKAKYTMADIGFLVGSSIRWASSPLDQMRVLTEEAIPELLDELEQHAKFEGGTVTYPTLKLSTFNLFYVPMFQCILENWENLCSRDSARALVARNNLKLSKKAKLDPEEEEDHRIQNANIYSGIIATMGKIVGRFFALIEITKNSRMSERGTSILLTALREGKKFIETFIRSEKLVAALFSIDTPAVMKTISHLQKATRQLHRLAIYPWQIVMIVFTNHPYCLVYVLMAKF